MKRIFNITLRAAAVVLTVALAAGCVFEKEDPTLVRGTKKVMVELNVGADDMATKATADSEKDIKDLHIYAFIGNVMVGYANPQSLSDTWYMDLNLPETGKYDIDFWAVANVDGLSGNSITISPNMSKDQLKSIVYSAEIVNSTSGYSGTGFPMYAMQTEQDVDVAAVVKDAGKDAANTSPGHEGHFILSKTVTLNLTRSLSKITVYAAEEGSTTASGIKISGVTVKNVPKTSNLFVRPTSLSADGLDESKPMALKNPADGKVSVTGLTNSTNYTNELKYTTVTQPYYIAENPNGDEWSNDFNCTTQVENATVVEVSYLLPGDKTSRTGTVYLPKIVRNTHYKVFCRIRANGKAEIRVEAVAWTYNKEEISFEDIVSMTGNPSWGEGSTATTTYQFGLAADQTATCTFNLQTPKNGTWYATIEGKDIQDFAFVDKNGQEVKMVSGSIGTLNDMKFTIKTLTQLGLGDSRTVNIRLVAKGVDGRTYNVKIGDADHFTVRQQ